MAATNLVGKLTAIADAIREKTGESGTLTLDAMAAAIEALETGGGTVIEKGTFTLSADSQFPYFELGKTDAYPSLVIITRTPDETIRTQGVHAVFYSIKSATASSSTFDIYLHSTTTSANLVDRPYVALNMTANLFVQAGKFKAVVSNYGSYSTFKAGIEHTWIAVWGATL